MFTPACRQTQLANSAHQDSQGPYFVQLLPGGCSPVPSWDLATETILALVEPEAGGGAGLPLPPVPPDFVPVCRVTPMAFMVIGPVTPSTGVTWWADCQRRTAPVVPDP